MVHRVSRSLQLASVALLIGCVAVPASAQAPPPAQTRWYLAEGATNAFFEEDILVGNPNATPADIEITFLRADGSAPVVEAFTMAATSRRTVRVNEVAGLENSGAVSAVVACTNGLGIVVERTMYWANGAKRGGHTSQAVGAPADTWYLAEGATGFFDTFVLIANAEDQPANIRVTFLKEDGKTIAHPPFTLAPRARTNIWVNLEVPGLEATAFSTVVESTNGTKVFVERAMYFAGGPFLSGAWEAGHGSAAVTGASTSWFFGEGFTGDSPALAFDTFLLLANPGSEKATVTVEFLLENDDPIVKTYDLAPTSRLNVWVDLLTDREGILGNSAFSARVVSTKPIIAERAMYWGPQANGVNVWHEAHNTPGVTSEALTWAFAEGVQGGNGPAGLPFESYFLVANTSATATLSLRATFLREDGTGIVRTFGIAPKTRFTLPATLFPELSNQKFAAFFESTNDVPFVAERAVYWGAGWFGGAAATGTPFTGAIATPPEPPAPKVTSVAPAEGYTPGGLLVTITGTNFRAGSTVTIGGAPAGNVSVVNATTIRAFTPARPAGPADVVVTSGTLSTTLLGGFTYVALPQPEILAVAPTSGPTSGGTDVTIDGVNLGTVVTVSFGGTPATAVNVVSGTRLVARTPARAVGKVDVSVRTQENLTATKAAAFEYLKLLATDTMLAFGDSNTEGYITSNCSWLITQTTASLVCDGTTDGGYPSRLQGLLRTEYAPQDVRVTNSGFGGEATAEGKVRLPSALTSAQDLAIIMEGVNDLNAGVDYRTIQENLRTMVRTAKAAGKAVMFGTVLPVVTVYYDYNGQSLPYTKADNAAIEELNRRIRIVASEEQVILVDFWASFKASSSMDGLFSGDGLHPNENGYNRMASLLRDLIVANFDGRPPVVP